MLYHCEKNNCSPSLRSIQSFVLSRSINRAPASAVAEAGKSHLPGGRKNCVIQCDKGFLRSCEVVVYKLHIDSYTAVSPQRSSSRFRTTPVLAWRVGVDIIHNSLYEEDHWSLCWDTVVQIIIEQNGNGWRDVNKLWIYYTREYEYDVRMMMCEVL